MSRSDRLIKTKNGRKMMKCKCAECGITKTKFIRGQTGTGLFDTALDTGYDLGIKYGIPYIAKKSAEMGRYYGSQALTNKKLQDKVGNYVVKNGKKYAKKPHKCRNG